jgi:biopolymer transport protein ExbD
MIKKLLFSFTLLLSLALNGQENKRENARMECIYANYPDKGLALKQLIKNFEKQLIEAKILTDSSGASYRKIIQRMANDTFIPYDFFDEFGDNWSKIESPFEIENNKCRKPNLKDSLLPFEVKIRAICEKNNPESSSDMAQILSQVLTNEDLELDFYKIKLFVFMATSAYVNNGHVTDKTLPPIYNSENAFIITINSKNEIYFDDRLYSISAISEKVKTYVLKNTSKTTIVINYNKDVTYANYHNLQQTVVDTIEKLKQEYAQHKYKVNYTQLNSSQKEETDLLYPLNLIDIMLE